MLRGHPLTRMVSRLVDDGSQFGGHARLFFRTIVKTMTSMILGRVLSVIRSGNNIIGYRKLIMANDRGRKFQSL